MTSSPDRDRAIGPLPPALSSMWRLCKLGYRHERRLMVAALGLSQLAALPDAFLALWLMLLGEGVLAHRPGMVEGAALGLGVSAAATWFLRTVSTRVQRGFRDKITIALESHVARLQASVATIAHQERPEYLDRLVMLRNHVFVLDHLYMSLFTTCGWILRLVVTIGLLMSIHRALVLLAVAAGSRLSAYIGATVGEIGFLRGIWIDGSRRLAWLEDYAAALVARADRPVPARLTQGIRFEHVSFAYPGTERLVLDDVNLDLPAGAVVAIVGENGAGKTTLVKLLAKLYEPTAGRILVDGVELARMPADEWRKRLAGAFQDFFRFEFRARHSVAVGDVPRLDDEPAVVAAVGRAGADDVVNGLAAGLESQLGPTWPGGGG